jgi:class 3 adenylate cyclase
MDIVVWLRSLGLLKYEAVFRENEIDETVLPSLTEEHLKQLGVTALGHRVKLLDAIAALRNDASGKTLAVDAAITSTVPSAHPEDRAERRQVTVMFSDLVGSTALSARMDPEDLDEKGSLFWKAWGMMHQGCTSVLIGKASDAVNIITSGITAWRSTGATMLVPFFLSYLARAHAQLGKFDDAWRCIGEAMAAVEATREKLWEADINRTAGEIALQSPEPNTAKAEACFERALSVARRQQAKSWELRAATSLARLWRDQGKAQQARELLAPVYGWFTEGFDTSDLKEAKALLEALAARNSPIAFWRLVT